MKAKPPKIPHVSFSQLPNRKLSKRIGNPKRKKKNVLAESGGHLVGESAGNDHAFGLTRASWGGR